MRHATHALLVSVIAVLVLSGCVETVAPPSDGSTLDARCGSLAGEPLSGQEFNSAGDFQICSKGPVRSAGYADGVFTWVCAGLNGGSDVTCEAPVQATGEPEDAVSIDGRCGTLDGASLTEYEFDSADDFELCSRGDITSIGYGSNAFSWTCTGRDGGTSDPCDASVEFENVPNDGTSSDDADPDGSDDPVNTAPGEGSDDAVPDPSDDADSDGSDDPVNTAPDDEPEDADDPLNGAPGAPQPGDDVPEDAFRGWYYDNVDFTGYYDTRLDDEIDFDWGSNAPLNGMGANTFSIEWQGVFTFREGTYEFAIATDDGMRIEIDGEEVFNEWYDQDKQYTTTVVFDETRDYLVRVRHYENGYGAAATVNWTYVENTGETCTTDDDCSSAEVCVFLENSNSGGSCMAADDSENAPSDGSGDDPVENTGETCTADSCSNGEVCDEGTGECVVPTVETYMVDASAGIGGSVSVAPNGPYGAGDTVTLTAAADEGYAFDSWNGVACNTQECEITIDSDVTASASFSEVEPVAQPVDGSCGAAVGGSFTESEYNALSSSQKCSEGDLGGLDGSDGDSWSWTCEGTGGGDDVSCDASRVRALALLTVRIAGEGAVTASGSADTSFTCSQSECSAYEFEVGSEVTLTADAADTHEFAEWRLSECVDGTEPTCTFEMPNEDKSAAVLFVSKTNYDVFIDVTFRPGAHYRYTDFSELKELDITATTSERFEFDMADEDVRASCNWYMGFWCGKKTITGTYWVEVENGEIVAKGYQSPEPDALYIESGHDRTRLVEDDEGATGGTGGGESPDPVLIGEMNYYYDTRTNPLASEPRYTYVSVYGIENDGDAPYTACYTQAVDTCSPGGIERTGPINQRLFELCEGDVLDTKGEPIVEDEVWTRTVYRDVDCE